MTLLSSPGATERKVSVPSNALLPRTIAPAQPSNRITGVPASGLRVDTPSSSNSFESRTRNAGPLSAFTCTSCSSSARVLRAFNPTFAEAITSLIRSPEIGISGRCSGTPVSSPKRVAPKSSLRLP